MWERIKGLVADDTFFYTLVVLLVGVTSFGLGRSASFTDSPVEEPASITMTEVTPVASSGLATATDASRIGQFVASKNGSKYHFPWCPGAQQMKEENKIWFDSKEIAQAQGYAPAANCPGL